MDQSSAEMFAHPTVKVGGFREYEAAINEASQAIFGRILSPEDFVSFIAAPDGAELLVEARKDEATIELRIGYKWFAETHDYLVFVEENRRVVQIDNVFVIEEAPELLETRLFARQVKSFQKFGIDQIRLFAAGHPGDSTYVGYYFWPRVGFVMYLGNVGAQLASAGLEYAQNTLELFSQPGGAEWWYNNGNEGEAIFYLGDDSPCVQALQIYLEEQGVNVDDDSDEDDAETQRGSC